MQVDPQPIACSLSATDARTRRAGWRTVADRALTEASRTPSGARQVYGAHPGVERELEELIRLEAECCAFLRFTLSRDRHALVLEVEGPEEAAGIFDLFADVNPPTYGE